MEIMGIDLRTIVKDNVAIRCDGCLEVIDGTPWRVNLLDIVASEAPVAYTLSAVAALVYVAATLGLAEVGPSSRRLAWAAVGFELVGVLTVGTLTVLDPELFPDQTVWSSYGAGYGWLPLVLPFVGLAWLWHTRPRR